MMLTNVTRPQLTRTDLQSVATVPNLITLSGYAATVWWLSGGPAWAAVAGLVADELDGYVARATGTTSKFGELFDWATDVTLTAMVLNRMGALYAAPLVTGAQVALRSENVRPAIGSVRAALTIVALLKEYGESK